MLDIHTHLYWKSYDEDREAVIARAREAGIKQMIVVGCDIDECQQSVDLVRQFDEMYASVGIHPNEFRKGESADGKDVSELVDTLEAFAKDEKVIAIGECGLDYSESHGGIDEDTKEKQRAGFVAQLELAQRLQLPVIVHCRDAYEDMLEILTNYLQPITNNEEGKENKTEEKLSVVGGELSVILHCYMGDTEVTRKFLELSNAFFSFTGNITYPVKKPLIGTKDDLTETVKLIPLERIFVETDCPFLAPQAKRGERNEPAFVNATAEKVCELLGITRRVLDQNLEENFSDVFQKSRG